MNKSKKHNPKFKKKKGDNYEKLKSIARSYFVNVQKNL